MNNRFVSFVISIFVFGATKFASVFESNGTTNFPAGEVEVLVNGASKGKMAVAGQTLGQVIRDRAKYHGLRTFSVYVDGRKIDTSEAIVNSTCAAKQIDLVAKDSRGTANFIWSV